MSGAGFTLPKNPARQDGLFDEVSTGVRARAAEAEAEDMKRTRLYDPGRVKVQVKSHNTTMLGMPPAQVRVPVAPPVEAPEPETTRAQSFSIDDSSHPQEPSESSYPTEASEPSYPVGISSHVQPIRAATIPAAQPPPQHAAPGPTYPTNPQPMQPATPVAVPTSYAPAPRRDWAGASSNSNLHAPYLPRSTPASAVPRARSDSGKLMPSLQSGPRGESHLGIVLGAIALIASLAMAVPILLPRTGDVRVGVTDREGNKVTKASVFVDGTLKCSATPCIVGKLPAGPRHIQVLADGITQPGDATVTIEAGRERTVAIQIGKP